jgi:hypothetical protein
MFGNFLGTILSSRHALTLAYRNFWNLLEQGYRSEFQQVIDVKSYTSNQRTSCAPFNLSAIIGSHRGVLV